MYTDEFEIAKARIMFILRSKYAYHDKLHPRIRLRIVKSYSAKESCKRETNYSDQKLTEVLKNIANLIELEVLLEG